MYRLNPIETKCTPTLTHNVGLSRTDRRTIVKQYGPDLSKRGHKNKNEKVDISSKDLSRACRRSMSQGDY